MTQNRSYASPPCMAAEIDPAYFDLLGVDPVQAYDVARWRRAERKRLSVLRQGLGQTWRELASRSICDHLKTVFESRGIGLGTAISGYWPIKCEPDLRPLLVDLHNSGFVVALPIVEVRAAPMVFRRWTPETRMVKGDWGIPVPASDAEALTPDIALAPCLGWDKECYRLGWGGGYFDRTFAKLAPRPLAIAIALSDTRLTTIYPQPHDIPFDLVVTEDGIVESRKERR